MQQMGWHPGPPSQPGKMPQITRLFIPNLDSFPDAITMTTLGVDDLVQSCYNMAHVKRHGPSHQPG